MKIGHVDLGKYPLVLAPMEDVTDLSFRKLCKESGTDLVYTEFVSADCLVHNIERTKRKLTMNESERPLAVQIYGKDPAVVEQAAIIVAESKPDILDINFGCPVRKVATKGAGAGLLRDHERLLEIASRVAKAVDMPVTAKTRLGWDDDTRYIVELAEALQDVGMQSVAIHGRTRAQMYTGNADWTLIEAVKSNPRMKIPIIGNGDVTTPERAKECFDRYGVDGVMIGRGAIGQHWIFREMKHYIETGEHLPPMSLSSQVDELKKLVFEGVSHLDERRGILHSRRHFAMTPALRGKEGVKDIRIRLLRADTLSEVNKILDEVVDRWG